MSGSTSAFEGEADVTSLDEFISTHRSRRYFNPLTVSTTASAPALRSIAIAWYSGDS
jgi:hypothetical protein